MPHLETGRRAAVSTVAGRRSPIPPPRPARASQHLNTAHASSSVMPVHTCRAPQARRYRDRATAAKGPVDFVFGGAPRHHLRLCPGERDIGGRRLS
ncbi:hypothetical protein I553_2671 [Mycobacterium xenopi 4042]|uniref:Uncharacterized protein n=1 Tax=Mycobacterium xenopi 4042 TaxID=1299334 RepID=X7Z3L4_MYCXE|nr:hypothetical protein I553_2671 [Mycobacterium xenopi 4042]